MFDIRADGITIGQTAFEYGDPPMGLVFGRFLPAPAFATFRQTSPGARSRLPQVRQWSDLTAVSPDGTLLDAQDVILQLLLPNSMEEGEEAEVTATGFPGPVYEHLFPHHIAEYNARFAPPADG